MDWPCHVWPQGIPEERPRTYQQHAWVISIMVKPQTLTLSDVGSNPTWPTTSGGARIPSWLGLPR